MGRTVTAAVRRPFRHQARGLLLGTVLGLASCTTRTPLPLPEPPLTPTPDAPFRTRVVVPTEVPVPDVHVEQRTLDNGLTVLHVEVPDSPGTAALFVNRGAGTLSTEYGTALVQLTLASLINGGTRWRDNRVLSRLRLNGVNLFSEIDPDASELGLFSLSSSFDEAVEIVARTVRAPVFEPGGLEATRTASQTAIRNEFSTEGSLALEHAIRGMIGQGAADELLGASARQLQRLSLADVERCYTDLYRPESSALVVAGSVSLDDAMAAAERHFGSWRTEAPGRSHTRRTLAISPPPTGVRIHVVQQWSSPRADVFLAQRAPAAVSDELVPFSIATIVLGGLFESRMNLALRHGPGASYGVHARVSSYSGGGVLLVHGEFEPRSAAASVRKILDELRRLRDEPLSPGESDVAKVRLSSDLRSSLDDVRSAAELAGGLFAYGDPTLLDRWKRDLATVDAARVQRTCARYLHPDAVDVVVFGNARGLMDDLDEIGTVDLYRITDPD